MSAQMHAQATSVRLETNFFLKITRKRWKLLSPLLWNKEALYVLCSAVKHLRGG